MVCFFFAWPPHDQLPTLAKRRWRDFDWLGSLLIISGAVLVVFPFQNAGEEGSETWSKPVFIVPLILGVFCWVALLVWEFLAQTVFKGRILLAFPVDLFKNKRYLSSVIVTLLVGFPYLLVIYSFPIRLQVVSQEEPLMAGVMLLPMLGTLAIGAVINGAVNKVKNYTAETLLLGTIIMTLGCGLMIMVEGSEDDSMALGLLTFIGLGFGLASGSATLFTLFECPISEYGMSAIRMNPGMTNEGPMQRLLKVSSLRFVSSEAASASQPPPLSPTDAHRSTCLISLPKISS
jgi:MFS family permease